MGGGSQLPRAAILPSTKKAFGSAPAIGRRWQQPADLTEALQGDGHTNLMQWLFMQNLANLKIEDLTPLSPEVISRQATINIGDARPRTNLPNPTRTPPPHHITNSMRNRRLELCFCAAI